MEDDFFFFFGKVEDEKLWDKKDVDTHFCEKEKSIRGRHARIFVNCLTENLTNSCEKHQY